MTVRSDSATIGGLETGELEDVEAGTAHGFDGLFVTGGDPGEELTVIVEGREIDTLSADDSLGRVSTTYARDELLAIAALGPTLVGLSILRGDGSEYVVQVEIAVDAPEDAGRKHPTAVA